MISLKHVLFLFSLDVYFTHEVLRQSIYTMKRLQVVQCDKEGNNVTVLFELYQGSVPSIVTSNEYFYWVNVTHRSIQR